MNLILSHYSRIHDSSSIAMSAWNGCDNSILRYRRHNSRRRRTNNAAAHADGLYPQSHWSCNMCRRVRVTSIDHRSFWVNVGAPWCMAANTSGRRVRISMSPLSRYNSMYQNYSKKRATIPLGHHKRLEQTGERRAHAETEKRLEMNGFVMWPY